MGVDLDREEAKSIREKTIGELGARNEFLPKWAASGPISEVVAASLRPSATSAHLAEIAASGSKRIFNVSAGKTAQVVIPSFYFPGWKAAVGDIPVPVTASSGGFLTCNVPAGAHRLTIWFGSTWPRILGWIIAALTLAIMGGWALSKFPLRSRSSRTAL